MKLTSKEINKIFDEYNEYCKHDGKKLNHLPFVIWLKYKKKITNFEYYSSKGEIIIHDKSV